jgi:hypothetical protein
MSLRDADARVLEQFLRTMAPPAVLTATYRQRVVRESLTARAQVLHWRRIQRLLGGLAVVGCCLLLPVYALVIAVSFWALPALSLDSTVALSESPGAVSMHAAVDGFELATIQTQFQARVEAWIEAQRGGER